MAMQFANNALFGIAIQQGAGGDDHLKAVAGYNVINETDSEFSYYPVTGLGFSPVKAQDSLGPEIGGSAFPSGMFVTGIWGEGPASLYARLSNRVGWLLLASTGDVESVVDTAIDSTTEMSGTEGSDTGVNTHIFRPYVSDKLWVPYMTVRRWLPHTTETERAGEVFQDCRVRSLTISGGAGGPVGVDVDIIGRAAQTGFTFVDDAAWTATYDTAADFAVTNCAGAFQIGGVSFSVTSASVTLANQTLGAQQSMYIGSIHPLDFPVLGRSMMVNATIMLEDYDLYMSYFKGTALDWSASTGDNPACDVYIDDMSLAFLTQTNIAGAGTPTPNEFRVVSNQTTDNVAFTVSPLRFRPNTPVILQVSGFFLASAVAEYPFFMFLQNAETDYALPV